MKPTIYSYISNMKKNGNMGFQAATTAIQREFEAGRVSYFRTDAYYHAPLTVLDDRCDPLVKSCIENQPKFYVEYDEGLYYVTVDKYIQPYILNIATPAEYIINGINFLNNFKMKEKKPKDFKQPDNLFIGLEQRLEEQKLLNLRKDLEEDFRFENFLKKVSANVKFKEKEIDYESIESSSKNIKIKMPEISLVA